MAFAVACNSDNDPIMRALVVYDYTPAPGQFINEGFSASSAFEAAEYAQMRLRRGEFVSLGAFGGSVVLGMGYISNSGGYDFGLVGNSFSDSSEPGIVSVMEDTNRNGLPDDTWYELAGSETDVRRNYSVTYFRPSSSHDDVRWVDCDGKEGAVERNSYHTQPYFPLWIDGDSYTLSGTLIKARNHETPQGWENGDFEFGYADNHSDVDMIYGGRTNYFRLSDAVDASGRKVYLKGADFVRVTTAIQASNPSIGEVSTEVCGMVVLEQ